MTLVCGHAEEALAEQREAGRAYCRECRKTRAIAKRLGEKCGRCGRKLNRYNTGPNCGPCDVALGRGRAA